MPVRRLAELTKDQMAACTGDVLVLPLGSTEQHGPHLAMGTDTLLAVEVAESATAELDDRVGVVLAPSLPYGVSGHHVFAGAASVRAETYQRWVMELLQSLAASGFSRFFLLNGHGGNHDSLSVVAKTAPLELGVSVAVCSYWNTVVGQLDDLGAIGVPGHAGMFETSLVLAVRPDLVDMSRAPSTTADPPAVWVSPPHPGLEVQLPGEWPRVGGYSDASAGADAALGRDFRTRVCTQVTRAIERFVALCDGREARGGAAHD
jgi:creatinine amidohydrolase